MLRMMQPDIHAATNSRPGRHLQVDLLEEENEDEIIVMDLPRGLQPKASRPKGQAVKVAVDPRDAGEDGETKLFLSSKPKSRNKINEALLSATLKMKAKAMPKQAATFSNKTPASAASCSKTQPGEMRGQGISPKAKAAPKATTELGRPVPTPRN